MLLCSVQKFYWGVPPIVESYFNATIAKYGLAELNERFGNVKLPQIEIIDTKKSLIKKE